MATTICSSSGAFGRACLAVARNPAAFGCIPLISRYTHTNETRDQEAADGNANPEAILPLIQRCKNLLASNWRGQLSSVKSDSDDAVYGSLAQYTLVGGQALVWLPKNDPHEANLLMDNRASLVVGHTDPRPLISALRAVGFVPPRAVVLGVLDPIPSSEIEYVRKRVLRLVSSTKEAVKNAGLRTRSILNESGSSIVTRVRGLDKLINSSTETFNIYNLDPRTCHFVDFSGVKHEVEVTELAGATVDHLCPVLGGIIEGINQSDSRRLALVMFCTVYAQTPVQDAYIFAADRWGINVLAKIKVRKDEDAGESQPPSEAQPGEWRDFRFPFDQEVRNAEHFCHVLVEMEKHCLETVKNVGKSVLGSV